MHTVGIENCPRCLLRDKTMAPLTLKVFDLSGSRFDSEAQATAIESRTEVPAEPELIRTESQS